ncbi:uncharacterized protein LOC121975356 [Zingiber officinale]|uniref:Uncharacterized protein n=1 Tax=Zingiber officinale TaxID=94328 RepID=A0A8J5IBF5_ZINOF|nr:uncharacterized protein LOC121975356 [Zingiber officinale]KAG6532350.1 hypothetical protein ZIOFF_006190 [Zingiber officinale]
MVPVHQGKSKLSQHPNSLPKLIRNVCAQCHGSCLRSPSTLSSSVDEIFDSDLSHKELIMLELQARAIRAKWRKPQELFTGRLTWAVSPTTGRVCVASTIRDIGNHEEDKEEEEEIGSEAFFSVKSCFSCCSVELGASFCTELKDYEYWGRKLPSIWEEFKGCQGWPFGLCRRAVVVLPPLPDSPSDSWTWHKKNLQATKTPAYTAVRTMN